MIAIVTSTFRFVDFPNPLVGEEPMPCHQKTPGKGRRRNVLENPRVSQIMGKYMICIVRGRGESPNEVMKELWFLFFSFFHEETLGQNEIND